MKHDASLLTAILLLLLAVPSSVIAYSKIDCGQPGACRELKIAGDPEASIPDGKKAPFRGYADPSLRFDPSDGSLWLSYSWLKVAGVPRFLRKPHIDFVVSTHLARSTDGGRSFKLIKAINQNNQATHAATGKKGWLGHEVSSLAQSATGQWQMTWLSYLDPFGKERYKPPHLSYSTANSPDRLGENSEPWIRGSVEPSVAGVKHNLSQLPGLNDCLTFSEPSLFSHQGKDYLALNCIIFKKGRRHFEQEKLLLFRQEKDQFQLAGQLTDYQDAKALGGERLEQGELTQAKDGSLLLLVTPQKGEAEHLGCYLFRVKSLDPPLMERDNMGRLVPLAHITDSISTEKGPGACSYDPQSATGVLIVRRDFNMDRKQFRMRFSIMETGYHP